MCSIIYGISSFIIAPALPVINKRLVGSSYSAAEFFLIWVLVRLVKTKLESPMNFPRTSWSPLANEKNYAFKKMGFLQMLRHRYYRMQVSLLKRAVAYLYVEKVEILKPCLHI